MIFTRSLAKPALAWMLHRCKDTEANSASQRCSMWHSPNLPPWVTELAGKDDRTQHYLSPSQERQTNLTSQRI